MRKRYVALARVSSREQEREGFSLDVQVDALRAYAERSGGEVVKLYRIAETASRSNERATFRKLLGYCRKNAARLDGVLFYKVDRAARNLRDFVEIEGLEEEQKLQLVFVSQPTENTPAGRMMRRTLANMASFYTEQQSLDVAEGMERRVQNGLFCGRAPFGYENYREDGRGLVRVHPENGPKVRRIFELYAHEGHTLDSMREALASEGVDYSPSRPQFSRSSLHRFLRDRSYLGEVSFRGQWFDGAHEALVDRATFERVQVLLGGKQYRPHESVYGAGMIECGHCGHPLVVEVKRKQVVNGEREYRYYRCTRYTQDGHPRVRVKEADLDAQVLALFGELRVSDERVHEWVVSVLRAKSREDDQERSRRSEVWKRELGRIEKTRARLLDLRLAEEIDAEAFGGKQRELRDREADLRLRIEAASRQQSEQGDLAVRVFELSQCLTARWDAADLAEKRQLLGIVCLNWTLDGVTLNGEMRKPFDVLAGEPLVVNGGPYWI